MDVLHYTAMTTKQSGAITAWKMLQTVNHQKQIIKVPAAYSEAQETAFLNFQFKNHCKLVEIWVTMFWNGIIL